MIVAMTVCMIVLMAMSVLGSSLSTVVMVMSVLGSRFIAVVMVMTDLRSRFVAVVVAVMEVVVVVIFMGRVGRRCGRCSGLAGCFALRTERFRTIMLRAPVVVGLEGPD